MNNKAAEEIRGTRNSHQLRGLKTLRDNRGRELRGRWNPPRDFWVAIATRAEYLSSLPGRGKRWNFIRGEDDFVTFVFNVKHTKSVFYSSAKTMVFLWRCVKDTKDEERTMDPKIIVNFVQGLKYICIDVATALNW